MSANTMSRQRKRELRELNKAAWTGDKSVFKLANSLDSSLKKNTAVIKRLRTSVNSETLSGLLKDIQTTSLEKYLPEIIAAVAEGLVKAKAADTVAIVEVVSALHQRFQEDFTPRLTFAIAKGLANPRAEALKNFTPEQREREEKERQARQRSLLRIGVELWLVGVLRTVQDAVGAEDVTGGKNGPTKTPTPTIRKKDDADAEPFPLEVLKELLGRDREHVMLPLVVLFIKNFAYDCLGVNVRNTTRKTVGEDGNTDIQPPGDDCEDGDSSTAPLVGQDANEAPLVTPELQQRFKNILTKYFDSVKAHIIRDHERLQAQNARNAEAYVRSGEIFEDRQATFERLMKIQEKLVSNSQALADALGVEMPELRDDKDEESKDSIIREGGSMFNREEGKSGIWEDEDQRRFYEDLVDLKIRVPPILLEDGKKKKQEGENTDPKPKQEEMKEEVNGEEAEQTEEEKKAAEEASMAIANKTIGAQVDALLLRLPELTNRDLIDQAAIDFCFLNSKASRNRLVRVLQEVPRSRQDLLPYYARLAATLNKYLPDIGKNLVDYLDKEFRGLQRRKEKDLYDSRARNARYLSELTKFGVVPEHVIFHCLKVAIEDFHRINIDIICHILENCGRYLLRNPETSPRMASFLETLKKKKDGVHLGPQERVAIENAFYYVNPPERPAIAQKQRSIMELFVRKLIYLDLTKRNYVKILKQLRKLHWDDPQVVTVLKKIFTKVWKVRYNNIHILAIIVGAIARYHQDWAYSVIDELLEQISVGLEENNFKHNQRRVALVKYLGELYNYKMIDSPVIFDALYRIVTFGHESGTPKPGVFCPLDPPDDFFRCRLVCALLDVCGGCFERGSAKKKLDFFLAFFQYYYYTKDPAPMDIEFLMQDTFAALRPNWAMHKNLEESAKAFEDAVAKSYTPIIDGQTAQEDNEDGSSSEDEDREVEPQDDGEDAREDEVDGEAGSEDGVAVEGDAEAEPQDSNSDSFGDDDLIVQKREQQLDPEEEAEFAREFAKVMQESLESRKFERKQVFDVPLPIRRAPTAGILTRENTIDDESAVTSSAEPEKKGMMMFSLLTKKGNRQTTKMLALPSDSGFAVAMKDKREKEQEEKRKIKELVMSYDRLEDSSDTDSLEKHGLANGYHVKIDNRAARAQPRNRKLSMSDVNWYDNTILPAPPTKSTHSKPCNPTKRRDSGRALLPKTKILSDSQHRPGNFLFGSTARPGHGKHMKKSAGDSSSPPPSTLGVTFDFDNGEWPVLMGHKNANGTPPTGRIIGRNVTTLV
ncbi:ARM repeat-containing protein [Ascodesmis nigricans]|uniref:ARM repeat-containing protein n=1 Tax=Ascodesmis nigricans TaxID=341454 RepID=A0A4S2N8J8_9PEZI|nr:ARM repeat-containing protein [Ascodesmis nigricans]